MPINFGKNAKENFKLYLLCLSCLVLTVSAVMSLFSSVIHAQTTNFWKIERNTGNNDLDFYLNTNGPSGASLRLNSGGSVLARIINDLDAPLIYFLDPNSNSVLKNLSVETLGLTGNLGIGTTTPRVTLDVAGMAIFDRNIAAQQASYLRLFRQGVERARIGLTANNDLSLMAGATDATALSVQTNGNVGIGTTTPLGKLTVGGFNDGDSLITYSPVNDALALQTLLNGQPNNGYGGAANILALQPVAGNVGIGTTAPSAMLDVNGTILSRGRLFTNEWIQLNNYGLYSSTNVAHFYPNNGSYGAWRIAGSRNGYNGIEFDTPGHQVSLMVGLGNPIETGFHKNGAGWLWYARDSALYAASYNPISDARLKKNITPLENALDKVLKLKGVNFEFDTDKKTDLVLPKGSQIGFLAQDVEKVVPEVVTVGANEYKAINYSNMVALLSEAIKEQEKKIEAQDQKIVKLEKIVEDMQLQIQSLKK